MGNLTDKECSKYDSGGDDDHETDPKNATGKLVQYRTASESSNCDENTLTESIYAAPTKKSITNVKYFFKVLELRQFDVDNNKVHTFSYVFYTF